MFDLAKGHVFILFLSYFIISPVLVIVMFCNHVASAHLEKKKHGFFVFLSRIFFVCVCVCVCVFSYKCPNYVLQKMRIKTIFFTSTLRISVGVFLFVFFCCCFVWFGMFWNRLPVKLVPKLRQKDFDVFAFSGFVSSCFYLETEKQTPHCACKERWPLKV